MFHTDGDGEWNYYHLPVWNQLPSYHLHYKMDISILFPPHVTIIVYFNVPSHSAQAISHTDLLQFTHMFHFFPVLHFHQNDVRSNLPDITEWYYKLFFSSEYPAQTSWARNDQMCDAARLFIKFYISHKSHPPAVTNINDFFFFRSKMRIGYTLPFWCILCALLS